VTRTVQQLLILTAWALLVIGVEWAIAVRPPHDDEYGKWLFASLLVTGMPWVFDSLPVLLIAFSLERRKRPRRFWITGIWSLIVACVAWVHLQPVFRPPAIDITEVRLRLQEFAYPRLFVLLIVLWIVLWLEKKLADRGLLN